MDTRYWHEFLALANTLNFTKASANLHMTQPTLSRHIADLEKQVGSPLFVRTTNSVKLTESGRMLYEKASAIAASYSSALDEVRSAFEKPTTTLKVTGGVFQPTMMSIVTRLSVQAALEQLPIRFEFHKTRNHSNEPPVPYSLDALASGEVDLVIDSFPVGEPLPRNIERMKLCDERLTVVASLQNPLASATGLKLEDLFACQLTTFVIQQHCALTHFEPFRKAGYSLSRAKSVYVDNVLEVPEKIGRISPNEIITLQERYCSSFGFDRGGFEHITMLDMADDRCKVSFYVLYRANEDNEAVNCALDLTGKLIGGFAENAAPEDWSDQDTLWSTALF